MKTASLHQLRADLSRVLAWVEAGESVAITRRRRVVARLTPANPAASPRPAGPDFRTRLRRNYGTKVVAAATMAGILAENRGRF